MKQNTRGNYIFVVGDTGKGLYASSGATRVTIVPGTSPVPAYAPDGSLNIVVSSSGYGYYHPSGAIRVTPANTQLGVVAPDGSVYAEGVSAALVLLTEYSPTDGLVFNATDNSLVIRDSVTPANDYTGPLIATNGTMNKFTFTRASTATYVNSSGLIQSAVIDAPRIDYSTGTASLLIEGAGTNLLTQSQDLSDWAMDTSGATIPVRTLNYGVSPDGTTNASRIVFNKTGGVFSRIQKGGVPTTIGQTYVFSFYAKSLTTTVNLGSRINGTAQNNIITTNWQRFTQTVIADISSNTFQLLLFDVIPENDETADVLIYGAQAELSSIATSYIPTTTVTVTRAADVCSIPNTLFNLTAGTGTLYSKNYWNGGTAVGASNRASISLDEGVGNEIAYLYNFSGTSGFLTADGGVNQAFAGDLAVASNVLSKAALAYAVNDFAFVQDSRSPVTDNSGTIPTPTALNIGQRLGGFSPLYGGITEAAFFGSRISNANMQALTT